MIVWRGLKQLGITHKKKTLHATEQDRPEVQEERTSFREEIEPIEPKRLVFVDETGVTTAMTPAYVPAPSGERVQASVSASASWESVTVIAAIGLDRFVRRRRLPEAQMPRSFKPMSSRRRCPSCVRETW